MPASPLRDADLIAFIATRDLSRAKAFYGDLLRLPLISEDQFGAMFNAHGSMLRIALVPAATPVSYTVLGWSVGDIGATVGELQECGVTMERYERMPQDELGIWKSPSGARVAWFKDPDGNTLSITQFDSSGR